VSVPVGFNFIEMAPGMGEPEIAEQAILLMQANVWRRESIDQSIIDTERSKHIVAATLANDRVVAAGAMEMFSPDYYYVTEIATDPHYRGAHTLGSRLLGMLEDTARSMGGQEIALSALSGSRSFFEKRGYVADLSPNISSLGMTKKL
jgi:N-acetylglutamate synthase-like GNAT family acetyltransferase